MLKINPQEIPSAELHHRILDTVVPRPIAFASTIDDDGNPNLSPFSFFNAFGVNPTTLIFSPGRRGRDNTTKHTYENLRLVPEVVINTVTYDMVQQVSLASTDYPKGVNEFIKAGFTMLPSEAVRPFRVKESPVHFECRVRDIIETGNLGGAANLVICEILLMHVDERILDEKGRVVPDKLRAVGRMGRDYYTKAYGEAIFEVEKPLARLGMGIDALPEKIRHSSLLTGNELGQLGNVEKIPGDHEIKAVMLIPEVRQIVDFSMNREDDLFLLAKKMLAAGNSQDALKVLLIS